MKSTTKGGHVGRWLLNSFPTWALAIVFVVGLSLLALIGAQVARRVVPSVAAGRFQETGTVLLSQTLAVYGIVLAFVIVNQYTDVTETRISVQDEALNIEDLLRTSEGFTGPSRGEMARAVETYVHTVVRDEWPRLEEGESSAKAGASLEHMYAVLNAHQPTQGAEISLYQQALSYLHATHEARHRRLDAASDALPPLLSVFTFFGAFATVGSSFLLGLDRHRLIVPVGLASLLGFTLLLSLTLDHPFSGSQGISTEHFFQGRLGDSF